MDAVHQAVGKDVHTLHLLAASAIEAVLDIALVKTTLVDGAGRPDQIAPVLEGTDHGQVHILVVIMNAGFHPRAEVPGVVRRGIDNRRVFTVGIHLDRSHGMRGNLNGQGECENIYADILEDGIPPTWKVGRAIRLAQLAKHLLCSAAIGDSGLCICRCDAIVWH